jgi:hypothetical protein
LNTILIHINLEHVTFGELARLAAVNPVAVRLALNDHPQVGEHPEPLRLPRVRTPVLHSYLTNSAVRNVEEKAGSKVISIETVGVAGVKLAIQVEDLTVAAVDVVDSNVDRAGPSHA